MKLTTAALVLLLSASSSAFAPSRAAFGVTSSRTTTGRANHWALPSTTVKKDEVMMVTNRTPSAAEIAEILAASTGDSGAFDLASDPKAEEARASAVAYLLQYENMTGAALIYSKLQELGVTVINGYSGGAVLPILDQFHEDHPRHQKESKYPPIRWITNSNENCAGHVSEGYAKAADIIDGQLPVGVTIATSGPGVTNLITPLQDAICDGVPMVVMCGQAATNAVKDAFQSSPAVALTTPCTKWSYQIKSAAEIPFVLDYAFFVARSGRPGPVYIDLPKDLQNQVINQDLIDSFINDNLMSNTNIDSLARLVPRRREDGEVFQAIHFGDREKGLAFEVAQHKGLLQLKAVTSASPTDAYHADHHPTNRIIHSQTVLNGELKKVTREGDLKHGSPMLKEITKLIQQAKKPVILAGQGCNDCPADLKAFAEALQIPVTTTLHALGCFDERHPLSLNMMGMHGHPTPNFMVQDSDLIICIGSRFDDRITGRPKDFIPAARVAAAEGRGGVIHVDIRLSENAAQVEPTYFVHSTGKSFLQTLNAQIQESPATPPTADWLQHMRKLQKEFPVGIPVFPTDKVEIVTPEGESKSIERTRISAQTAVTEMNKQILAAGKSDETLFATGVGIHQMVTAQLVTWTYPRQMLSSGSLGTMGVCIGFTIGGKLAQCKKMVIGIDGDGSFNMTFTELKTVAEQKIPIKMMILDNESQMMVEYWQRLFHEARFLAVRNSHNPDYCKLASAFGIKSIYCDCLEDLPARMHDFLWSDPDEPVLFHVRIERTPCLPLVAPGQALDNMILEDKDFDVDPAAAPS